MKAGQDKNRVGRSARYVSLSQKGAMERSTPDLPHALDVEETVLGTLMLVPSPIHLVADLLQESFFYDERHQLIYAAMAELYEQSFPIDLLTVRDRLRRRGDLAAAGGLGYLSELSSMSLSTANIEYHCRILAQYAVKRQVIEAAAQLLEQGQDLISDPFDLLDDFQNAALRISQSVIGKESAHVSRVAMRRFKAVMDLKGVKGVQGLPSGFTAIDNILGGFHAGDLGIIAARPGMGKTALALGIATKVAMQGLAVDIFSLEMTEDQLVDRQAAQLGSVSAAKIRKGNLTEVDCEQLATGYTQLAELDIYIDDTAGIDLLELKAKAKRSKLKNNTGLIIIDYIQQIEYTGKDAYNREQAVAIIAKQLKKLAKELEIPVIVLAQLSRAVETRGGTKRPQLSDLRESGQIEQEADWVAFIYRPEYYQILEDENGGSLKGVGEFIVAKNRHGETETAKLKWEGAFTRFSNWQEDESFDDVVGVEPPASPNLIIRRSKLNDDEDVPF